MKLDPNHFWSFCAKLKIPTKDYGTKAFDEPLGTQRYFIQEVFKALEDDVHALVCLKGRQLGASTVMLALDLYWMFMFRGIMGTIVTQDEPTRDLFREQLGQYYDSLPRQWRQRKKMHNRYMFMFQNNSGFAYQIAGSRVGNKLGRGKGITFAHMTELGSWGNNVDGLASLKASFSEVHPHRLYIYESTANGYDMFYDLYDTATRAVTTRAIFLPWWMKETYAAPENSQVFKAYFGKTCETSQVIKKLDQQEVEWYKAVQRDFGVSLLPEQVAWWRWKYTEEFSEDLDLVHQEYPACVVGDTRVGTENGLIPIREAYVGIKATYGEVAKTFPSEKAVPVYRMLTNKGYWLDGTADHPIFSAGGVMVPLRECAGIEVKLDAPMFASREYVVQWKTMLVEHQIRITPEFGRFVGVFMGDGSFYNKRGSEGSVLSIACDSKDMDFIADTADLIKNIFGLTASLRSVGKNGAELRANSKDLFFIFNSLGLLKQFGDGDGRFVRKVHVPEFIFRSPKDVVKEFLRGIFETDGFNGFGHNRVCLFSKYESFMHDVQLLLLGFGITCSLRTEIKKSKGSNGQVHEYIGYSLNLNANESIKFNQDIGFLSERKRSRFNPNSKHDSRRKPLTMTDEVVSVTPIGIEPVYNLEVPGKSVFDANGIHTHNTADYAFRLTGSQFYPSGALNDLLQLAKDRPFAPYYITFGARFEDTMVVPCEEEHANLKIYTPAMEGGARAGMYYTLGADPAYGSNEWKDGSAIHIDRVYGDYVEQVAEFHSTTCTATQFAWVIAILAGWYENTLVNLELNGPGAVVYQELDQLQKIVMSVPSSDQKALANIVRNVQHYIYYKYNGGSRNGSIRHTVTTQASKETMMTKHRDSVVKGITDIASIECIYEMKKVVREGGSIEAQGRDKDDRVIAAALAHTAWLDNLRVRLMTLGITKKKSADIEKVQANPTEMTPATFAFHRFMAHREQALKQQARQARSTARQMRR